MAYTRVWDETQPAGTVLANTIDTVVQNFKTDMRERLAGIFGLTSLQFAADPIVPISLQLSTAINFGTPLPNASVGYIRTPNNQTIIAARNAGNTVDIVFLSLDAANIWQVGGGNVVNAAGGITGVLGTAAQPNITSLGTLTAINLNGTLNMAAGGNDSARIISSTSSIAFWDSGNANAQLTIANATGNVTIRGTVTAPTFIGALTGNVTGTVLTAAQGSITSVGTLTSLTVSGALNATITTAAQPNITSVGVLTSLSVSGNTTHGTATTAVPCVFFNGTVAGNKGMEFQELGTTVGRIFVAGQHLFIEATDFFFRRFTGSVQVASIDTNGNVTGNSFIGPLTGTVSTAAQPNITSLGSLTTLTVTGPIIHGASRTYNGASTTCSIGVTTTIYTVVNNKLAYVIVSGDSGTGKTFLDTIAIDAGNVAISTQGSSTLFGVPGARTYSISGNNLQLNMAATAMIVKVYPIEFI